MTIATRKMHDRTSTRTSTCGIAHLLVLLLLVVNSRMTTLAEAAPTSHVDSPASHQSWAEMAEKGNDAAPRQSRDTSVRVDVASLTSVQYDCYRNMCMCHGSNADCSQNFGGLSFIPALPQDIIYLNFSFNNLTMIQHEDFFSNVTQLRGLDLRNNGLSHVLNTSFRIMTALEELILNYNHLNYSNLDFVSAVPSLRRLDLIRGVPYLGPLPPDFFRLHPMPSLEILNLHDNTLGLLPLNMTAFQPLPRLIHLGLGHNEIARINQDYLPNLSSLVLHSNRLYDFPETCGLGGPYFPQLRELHLDNNAISDLAYQTVCLPDLRILDLSRNALREVLPYTFNTSRFPSLQTLFFRSNSITLRKLYANAFTSQSLKLMSFLNNAVRFSDDHSVHPDAFAGCPALQILQLDGNVFTNTRDDKFQQLFGQVPKLRQLFFSYCQIYNISSHTFKGLSNLVTLYLSQNALLEIPDGAFDTLLKLKVLVINNNRISSFEEDVMDSQVRGQLTRLDLSGNPFVCDCSVRWLQQWMRSNSSPFSHSYTTYLCSNLPHTRLSQFYTTDQACLLSHDTSVFTVVTLTLILVTLILCSSVFRFRWHLRLMLYQALEGGPDRRRLYLQADRWQYDVFVSYSEEDQHWVRQHLMPRLEGGRQPLRLCVKDRDFPPNEPEIRSLERSLEVSKKTLLLFSASFARDETCQFELRVSLRHALDHGDMPLVICLHDIPSRDMTAAMLALLKNTDYFQWGTDRDVASSCWGRLRLALGEIMPAPREG